MPGGRQRSASFRLRLLLGSALIEIIMLSLLVANGARLIHDHLLRNTQQRLAAQEASFGIALAGPLAASDYGSVHAIVQGWGEINGILYMVVEDLSGRRVGAFNRAGATPAATADAALTYADPVYDGGFDVILLGQRYGRVSYGMDTSFLGLARRELILQSLGIAGAEVLLTLGMLSGMVFWLTRRLNQLTQASLRVANGDFAIALPSGGSDEIGLLAKAFRIMLDAVQTKMADLRDSERRFRAIADYTHAWESWFGTDGRLRWVNPAVERLTGYSPADCGRMADFPLALVDDPDRATLAAALDEARAGKSGQDVEFRVRRRDGSLVWAAMSWQPIFDESGEPLGFRSSIRDIAQQKHNAALLIDAKTELERMLFAASHDLREPVRIVLMHGQVLTRELGGDLPPRVAEVLATITTASQQMNLLVKGLGEFSHASHPAGVFADVDCRALVDKVLSDLPILNDRASPDCISIGTLPHLHGAASLLFILFRNIIDNAIRYVPAGTLPEIRIDAIAAEGGWRIDIADNGIGIEPEYVATISRPFSRMHSRTEYPGAGLGLASAEKIIAAHGGRMEMDSRPGHGSVVHLWFPPPPQTGSCS